jgi:hypothetical protein
MKIPAKPPTQVASQSKTFHVRTLNAFALIASMFYLIAPAAKAVSNPAPLLKFAVQPKWYKAKPVKVQISNPAMR